MSRKTVKIDIMVRAEIKQHGLIIDHKGHIFKLPFVSSNGRKYKLKEIKPFWNNKTYKGKNKESISSYQALTLGRVIYNHDKIIKEAIPVNYKMRFEVNPDAVPEDIKNNIIH